MFASLENETGARGGTNRRAASLALSYALEALVLAILIALPLMVTNALPRPQWLSPILAPPSAPPAPHVAEVSHSAVRRNQSVSDMDEGHLRQPGRIPIHIAQVDDAGLRNADPFLLGSHEGPGVPASTGTGDGVLQTLLKNPSRPNLKPEVPTGPVRRSHLDPGDLIMRVDPVYPAMAKNIRVQGSVVMAALIARDGTIQDLRVLSGHPMLVAAALNAVKQWRYRPYILNGEAVEVETQITVNFVLGQ